MIKHLITRLQQSKHVTPDLSAEDIADALWLALQMGPADGTSLPSDDRGITEHHGQPGASAPPTPTPGSGEPSRTKDPGTPELPDLPEGERYADLLPDDGVQPDDTDEDNNDAHWLSFKTPAAHALTHRLDLVRALRPLMRKVATPAIQEFDEEATVQHIAEADVWCPVHKPAQTRWLDVALVVDESPSMIIWKTLVAELQQMLERQGAFRDVRVWGINTVDTINVDVDVNVEDEDTSGIETNRSLSLHYGAWSQSSNRRTAKPRELVDPAQRRLVCVVSDCVAPAWHDGSILRVLQTWGQHNIVTVMQVLPDWLWDRTQLGKAMLVHVSASSPGKPNSMLSFQEPRRRLGRKKPESESKPEQLCLPVVSLDPTFLGDWAKTIAGVAEVTTPAFVFDVPSQRDISARRVSTSSSSPTNTRSADERVQTFQQTASPLARHLAGLLASAAPLNFHVMRLVQHALLPESSQVHLSEVFLSGLLKPTNRQIAAGGDPDNQQYDFINGIRDKLRMTLPVYEAKHVLDVVSEYISERIGHPLDFHSLLADPARADKLGEEYRPFANVSASVLRSFGGEYARMAQRLQRSLAGEVVREPVSEPLLQEQGQEQSNVEILPESKAGEKAVVEEPKPIPKPPDYTKYAGMSDYADLEIGIHRRYVMNYTVDLRFFDQQNDTDIRLISGSDLPLVRFDFEQLRSLTLDPYAYGAALTAMLFADPNVVAEFDKAYTRATSQGTPLRVRLFIGSSAPDLHALRWETLHFLDNDNWLFTNEFIIFSRYISSSDWRPVRLRPKGDVRALVILPNPTDVTDYAPNGIPLTPMHIESEIAHVRESLGDSVETTFLASNGTATLENIMSHLRDDYDILYLVTHSAFVQGEPMLWLENVEGKADVIRGQELVHAIRDIPQPPRIVVLTACLSEGSEYKQYSKDRGGLVLLGPSLAEIGIPAVLAMQDNITMQTVATFMPIFFQELLRDGQIDRAMAVARGVVQDRPDWWVPVLFTRMRRGRIWYEPVFSDEREDFKKWPTLLYTMRKGYFTPIIGTQFGDMPNILLPQMAKYLAVEQGEPLFPHEELLEEMRRYILDHYGSILTDDERQGTLEELFAAVGRIRRQYEDDPYRVLAELPFPVYIMADWTNLLEEALRATGKQPIVQMFRWNDYIDRDLEMYNKELDSDPTVERPLVYHLFGHLSELNSLVVTEDDYLDYSIQLSFNNDLIPGVVLKALVSNGLLLLGFQPDDWDFRFLFRNLANNWNSHLRRRHMRIMNISPHIALDGERIKKYREESLRNEGIDVYWGTVEDFVRDLREQWYAAQSE